MAVKVLDGALVNDSVNTWHDDAVEIFIDANHNHAASYELTGGANGNGYDRQFIKGWNDSGLGGTGSNTGVLHGWAPITGGYSVEMAIPWANINTTPVGGTTVIGFDVGVDDDDNSGNRESQMMWAGAANNSSNTSAFGDCALSSATVGGTAPAAPSGLSATAVSSGQINLSWTDNSGNESGFNIDRKEGAGGAYQQVGSVGAGVTSFQDVAGLGASLEYYYRVRAYNAIGDSGYSNEASAVTSRLVVALKTLSSVTIDGNINEGVWALTNDVTKLVNGASPDNTVTFATLWDATYLYVAVKVLDSNLYNDSASVWLDDSVEVYIDGNHSRSASYELTGGANGQGNDRQFTKGYNDSGLGGSTYNTGVLHAWAAIAGGYSIEMAIPWSNVNVAPAGDATLIGFDVGVNDDDNGGTTRESHLMWAGASNNSSNTSAFGDLLISTETVGDSPPTAPSGLAVGAISSSQINLSWTDNAANESGHAIERKTGSRGIYEEIATVAASVVAFQDTGLTPDTTYYYRVCAFHASGTSGYASEAGATTTKATHALRTVATMTVNGNLNESVWSEVAFNPVSKLVNGSSPNNTVSFATLWNDSYLFVGVQVLDGSLYNDSTNTWQDDSVEVFVDANYNKAASYELTGGANGNGFDRQFTKGYNDSGLAGTAYNRACPKIADFSYRGMK